MTDLERIRFIEEILGYKLKRIDPGKIAQEYFYARNPFRYILSYRQSPEFPYKGARCYCLNKDDNLSGLALDYAPCFLLPQDVLAGIRNITFLSLRSAGISDVSFLKELKGLTSLNLSDNKLSDVSFLKELKGLTSLNLSAKSIYSSDVSFLKELKGLTSLNLSGNYLTDVSFLKELKGLTSLNLSANKLSDVSFLKELKGLSSLDLSDNKLSDVSFLKELKGLASLDLSSNKLSDVSFLKELKGLTSLDLSDNKLSDVSFLKGLKGLTSLDLHGNNLSDFSFLKELKGLAEVNLSNNEVKAFEPWLVEKGLNIRIDSRFKTACINLDGNPLESPPLEVVKQGNTAIRKYFIDIGEEGTDYIYEAKLLILGEPGAGKTSLARKIIDINAHLPKEKETTRGIDVDKWRFPHLIHDRREKTITANIWDFGGQAIYKATHRFFLSHRSLYIIVADARKENTDFYYWLHTVELFSEESPVMIVINEKYDRKRDLPYQNLRARFDILRDKKEVNLKKPDHRLNTLIDKLKYDISHLQHIGDPIPANWKKIRNDIAEAEKRDKAITLKDYRRICKRHNLLDYKDQDMVCEFFHDLGVFLHFKDDDVLNHIIFLDKEWILEGAYRIIDDKDLAERKGRFTREDIENIFCDEYADCISEIIAMMKKFYLVYEKDSFIIAPQMLPYDAPDYEWDSKQNIQFNFVYDIFMPAGILWQFIVEMKDEIKDELVWRYGVVLDFGNTQAEVIEISERNLVQIRAKGKRREDIRAIIIRKIEEINRQFKKLKNKKNGSMRLQ
jgi:internalin A